MQGTDWLTRTEEKILVEIYRIAMGTVVRWPRKVAESRQTVDEEDKQSFEQDETQKYTSRMLACTRCGTLQETKCMQLRIVEAGC